MYFIASGPRPEPKVAKWGCLHALFPNWSLSRERWLSLQTAWGRADEARVAGAGRGGLGAQDEWQGGERPVEGRWKAARETQIHSPHN